MTTFVTTDQKSTRKTPPIDDVCNNTQRRAPKSQHDKPDHIGGPENPAAVPMGGGEACPYNTQTPRPIGGRREACGAWPGFEPTHRAKLAARTASGRAGRAAAGDLSGQQAATCGADGERAGRRPRAHQAARPKKADAAPATPVGPQATSNKQRTQKRPPGNGWAYLSRLWESNPRPIHYE